MRYISTYMLCGLNGKIPKSIDIEYIVSSVDEFSLWLLNELTALSESSLNQNKCNDKVSMANKVYEIIYKTIRLLNTDLQQYKRKTFKRIKSKSDSKCSGQLSPEIPYMVALMLALTDKNDDGKKMVRWALFIYFFFLTKDLV